MTDNGHQQIRELIARVRARWRRLMVLRAAVRAGLAATLVLGIAFGLTYWMSGAPAALSALAVLALALLLGVLGWGFWPVRRKPSDAQVARFIEESDPALEDRLVSAVDLLDAKREVDAPAFAAPMIADAARRSSAIVPSNVLPKVALRRAALQAAAAAVLLLLVVLLGRNAVRQSYDALAVTLLPSGLTLDVKPGNARVAPGAPLVIEAHLKGNRAPVVARVLRADGSESGEDVWHPLEMTGGESGSFTLAMESIGASFKYRVAAGMMTSPTYEVTVTRPPRVTRIQVEYVYPPAFGLAPHTEEDGGDLYAPAGTEARLQVHTDRAVSEGRLVIEGGQSINLTPQGNALSGALKIVADGSYRVALADAEGFKNPGDTEYFVRILEDRPPEVRVLRPARDRTVTPLEEVEVEAEADDDYGIDRFDLVYAVGAGAPRTVPLAVPRRQASINGAATLYLEDLGVRPGDFVSYYVRARDVARGKRSSETRSDIFFLEVKPFEQEFRLAQSQAQGAGGNRQLDDLVSAQKEIIVATWKLDRRTAIANGAKSEQDIRSVGRAEAELKTRVEQTSSAFRTSTMRDPGGRTPGRGGAPPSGGARAGQSTSEEEAMTAAALAMGHAVTALNGLKTREAIQPEMEALNHLLRAQGEIKERQIARQPGSGAGSNRTTQDLSSLFDRELQRQQQTNYETATNTEQQQDENASLLEKIKELARRQDELLREQRDLARDRGQMTPEELKRQLEKLTRDQSELRQRADDLARQLGQQNQSGQRNQQGQRTQSGQQQASGQQSGQSRPGSQSRGSQSSERMRAASEEMRNAAGDLGRQDPAQASERGRRALERLREIERELQGSGAPDERRRARGDMQLEARQLADRQRQIESELSRLGQGGAADDAVRRLAGEEDRLAERAQALQQGLGKQAASSGDDQDARTQQAVAQASREFNQQRVGERMQQSAEQMRTGAGRSGQSDPQSARRTAAATQRDLARALDNLADRLASAEGARDEDTRKMSDQLARAQELRERIEELTRELEDLAQRAESSAQSSSSRGRPSQGQSNETGSSPVDRLREAYTRQLQETRELLGELQRDDNTFARGGLGFTFEGQGMVLSAPGTEAFKQDFSKWDALRKQATQALERAESSLSKRLQTKASRDRLAAGVEDAAPSNYQQQVDSYFKALAKGSR